MLPTCGRSIIAEHNGCLKVHNVINSSGAEHRTAVAGRPGRALADRAVDSLMRTESVTDIR